MTEKANAPGILEAVIGSSCNELDETKDALMKKMAGLGSDSAAVMTGIRSGVATLLKKDQPSLIGIHCLAAHHYQVVDVLYLVCH